MRIVDIVQNLVKSNKPEAPVTRPEPITIPRPSRTEPKKPSRPLTPPKHAPKPNPKAEGLTETEQNVLDKIVKRYKNLKDETN